ncbi:hypothetical protein IMZ48_40260 [Candidatus Bathyarchaeota archaeon]|nr:hypothetical protein [Candidatus Bathyarchaeota archaeon]
MRLSEELLTSVLKVSLFGWRMAMRMLVVRGRSRRTSFAVGDTCHEVRNAKPHSLHLPAISHLTCW